MHFPVSRLSKTLYIEALNTCLYCNALSYKASVQNLNSAVLQLSIHSTGSVGNTAFCLPCSGSAASK